MSAEKVVTGLGSYAHSLGDIYDRVIYRPVLNAFAAFEPEAVGMETLAHETGLSQAIVADCLIEMARRKEIIVSTEDIVIADDGTLSHKLAFPTLITGMTCYSVTTYRVNKDRKQEAA